MLVGAATHTIPALQSLCSQLVPSSLWKSVSDCVCGPGLGCPVVRSATR